MNDVTLLITDEQMLAHDPGPEVPETPARLRAVLEKLRGHAGAGSDAVDRIEWATPAPASRDDLMLIHTESHVDQLESLRGITASLDWDTNTSPRTIVAAHLAAGAAIHAVDVVLDGSARNSFALVRPPGHHAEPQRAMGFCFYNNIAIAAAHAIARRACSRVLIIDWDVHHGNGTQAAFFARDDVLVFNTHQHPLYPGTGGVSEAGRSQGEGFTVNCPLPAGCGDGLYCGLYDRLLTPLVKQFKPELILVSAGFDAHQRDPLGSMQVTTDGFAAMCGIMKQLADEACDGRIALVLEGGYDLEGLSQGVLACVRTLIGELNAVVSPPNKDEQQLIDRFLSMHGRWTKV